MNLRHWVFAGAIVAWFVLLAGAFWIYGFSWLYFSLPPVGRYDDPNFAYIGLCLSSLTLMAGIAVATRFLFVSHRATTKEISWYAVSGVLRYSIVVVGMTLLFATLSLYKGVIDGTGVVRRIAAEEQCPDFLHETGGELDCVVYPDEATSIRAKILTGFYKEVRWSIAHGALLGHVIGLLAVLFLVVRSACNDIRK